MNGKEMEESFKIDKGPNMYKGFGNRLNTPFGNYLIINKLIINKLFGNYLGTDWVFFGSYGEFLEIVL